jgi:hypothetical protein
VRALVVVKHGIAKYKETSRAVESKGGRGWDRLGKSERENKKEG